MGQKTKLIYSSFWAVDSSLASWEMSDQCRLGEDYDVSGNHPEETDDPEKQALGAYRMGPAAVNNRHMQRRQGEER